MEVSTKFSTFAANRPHPGSIMKEWMIKAIYQHLKEYGHIK